MGFLFGELNIYQNLIIMYNIFHYYYYYYGCTCTKGDETISQYPFKLNQNAQLFIISKLK